MIFQGPCNTLYGALEIVLLSPMRLQVAEPFRRLQDPFNEEDICKYSKIPNTLGGCFRQMLGDFTGALRAMEGAREIRTSLEEALRSGNSA